MNYSTLTPAQLAQCEYLFADDAFGTDPYAYDYEVKGNRVMGRKIQKAEDRRMNVKKPHTVSVNVAVREVPNEFVTVEMKRNAAQAIKDLARNAVERINQIQSQEA